MSLIGRGLILEGKFGLFGTEEERSVCSVLKEYECKVLYDLQGFFAL